MATRIDYANGIDATDIGTIYLTGAGYVNYPFRGASRESALGWEEPVWGGELDRNLDLVIENIDKVDYGLVARCEISYKYLNVEDYKVLCKIAKQRVCKANFFNKETGERMIREMAFTGNELSKLYKFGTEYLGVIDMAIKLVATNRDQKDVISATHTITYNANGGTGTIAQQSVKWAGRITLADSGFTITGGYPLIGWNTQPDGSGESYELGQSITVFGDLTLYAKWEEPTVVTITNKATMTSWNGYARFEVEYNSQTIQETGAGQQNSVQVDTFLDDSLVIKKISGTGSTLNYLEVESIDTDGTATYVRDSSNKTKITLSYTNATYVNIIIDFIIVSTPF